MTRGPPGERRAAVDLTPSAAREIERLAARRGLGPDWALYLTAREGGCSGFSYGMDLRPPPGGPMHRCATTGIRIALDARTAPLFDGLEIDFVDDALNRGFVFRNPNARRTCGCGSSFGT